MNPLETLLTVIPEDTLFINSEGIIISLSKTLEGFFLQHCHEDFSADKITGSHLKEVWKNILSEQYPHGDLLEKIDHLIKGSAKNILIEIPGCNREEPRSIFLNVLRIPQLQDYLPIQHIDVTEWLKGESSLIKNLKKLEHIINNQAEFICLMHPDSRVTFINDSFRSYLSIPYEDTLEQPFYNLLPYGKIREEFQQKLTRLTPENPSFTIEYITSDSKANRDARCIQWAIKGLMNRDNRITALHGTGREITNASVEKAIQQKEQALIKLAYNDPVTGLPNRVLFIDRLNQLIIRAKRYRIKFGVMFLDLDNFKKVNESLGYDIGDRLLKAASLRISPCLRDSDIVSRIGGDDFAIILSEIDRAENAVIAAQRIIKAMRDPFSLQGNVIYITASIGISIYPDDGDAPERLLKNAETAMYYAKTQEKNTYQFFNQSMNQYALEKLNVENDMRRAIENKEFLLHFQPQISIQTGKIVGAEALVRWLHPDKGQISPGKFIPVAEETGLIVPMSELIIKQAIEQAVLWTEIGLPAVTMAVNISLKHFKKADFADFVIETIHDAKVNPSMFELELTESILMQDVQGVISTLERFRGEGIQVSIDDFGTGYSSLSYLKNLPISKLKIDRSFVNNITVDQKDAMIVKTIIEIAHNLGLKVIAEGVEHLEQMKFLGDLRCDELQGFFFSRPLPAHEFRKLMETMMIL